VELTSADGSGAVSIGAFRNEVARRASTELLAFVHVRLTPRAPDWLVEMVSHFAYDACVAVGACVIAPDGRVEQCGVLLGVVETQEQPFPVARGLHGAADGDHGHQCRGRLSHRASALAGTAMLVRTSTVLALGGFDEGLVDAASVDLDFTLRARRHGGTLITCPMATFDATEARPWFQDAAERGLLLDRFAELGEEDPFYNPNLTSTGTDFGLAFPPRARFPWRT
jgi:GT2 family glycosyltransferase